MKRILGDNGLRLIVVVVLVLISSVSARADYLFTVAYSDLGSLTFTETSLTGSGTVTSFVSNTLGATSFSWNGNAGGFCDAVLGPFSQGPSSGCSAINEVNPGGGGGSQLDFFAPPAFFSSGTFIGGNGFTTITITQTSAVPEPSSLLLLGIGSIGLLTRKRNQRRRIK
jgi:hypothetical protein